MRKLGYMLIVVFVTTIGTLFYFKHWIMNEATVAVMGENQNVGSQGSVNQVILSQEEARINAIEDVTAAIVGVINLNNGTTQGKGSGVIYKVEDGATFLVTNEHVISGGNSFVIVFSDESQKEAELIGSDIYTDLAILKITDFEAEVVATFGDSESLQIGQSVIAIGNPLGLEFAGSATFGIISGQERSVAVTLNNTNEEWEMTVLQTDAAINPGNSGGALINLSGEVIGINSMKFAATHIEGMSFAIPTQIVLPIIEDLETHHEVIRPVLGIATRNVREIPQTFRSALGIPLEKETGAYIESVASQSLAEEMGLLQGDVILTLNEVEISSVSQLRRRLFSYREGETIDVTVLRGQEILTLTAQIQIR